MRCYFWERVPDSSEMGRYGRCHSSAYATEDDFAPADDWWCSEFRPHPDHACLACDADPMELGDDGIEKCPRGPGFQCSTCHGKGLRPSEDPS